MRKGAPEALIGRRILLAGRQSPWTAEFIFSPTCQRIATLAIYDYPRGIFRDALEPSRPENRKNEDIWLVAEWTRERRDCLQPLPSWFLDRLHAYRRQKIATTLYDVHRSERLNVPAEPLFFVPNHTARSLKTDLRRAGIETTTPEGKLDFHTLRTTFSTLLDEVGATEKTKEVLLRHAPSTLAHKRYVKVRPGRPNEAVNQVAELLGLAYLYANSMPMPQKMAVGQKHATL